MKIIAITLSVVMLFSVTAEAKTTIKVDRRSKTVTVDTNKVHKTGKYKVKNMYTVSRTRLYKDISDPVKTVSKGTKIKRVMKGKKYSVCQYKKHYYLVKNKQLTKEIPAKAQYSASYFRKMGVIHWGKYRWTWYSQRVLPGGGLKIPGRHVDEHGYICDENGYICAASSKLKRGTVLDTPFGKKAKIYDSGCACQTIDIYTNF